MRIGEKISFHEGMAKRQLFIATSSIKFKTDLTIRTTGEAGNWIQNATQATTYLKIIIKKRQITSDIIEHLH
jgi:hypothetical protein